MMKWSSSTPLARQASRKSSSQMPGFVSPVYLVMLEGGRKRCGNGALRMRRLKAHGPGPSRLGLRSSGRRPHLERVSPLPSMVWPVSVSLAAVRRILLSCRARCRSLMTLRASWCGSGRSRADGRCGAGARSDRHAAAAPRAEPDGCSGERTKQSGWCVPVPPVGREGAGRSRDAELSACWTAAASTRTQRFR